MKRQADKSEKLINDIVEWDVKNWWRAIEYWEETCQFDDMKGKKVLDIGGRGGGLSLYWALKGAEVICSDVSGDSFEAAQLLHERYGVGNKIKYEVIDATKIPYQNVFDIICFKSVLGGIGYDDNFDRQKQALENIYAALNENGKLCFCENLIASPIHQYARKKFTGWGSRWRYLTTAEIKELTKEFQTIQFRTFGFWGVFGRTKWLSNILGALDRYTDRLVNEEHRYIISCVCNKKREKAACKGEADRIAGGEEG